jgi:hypothetical protein
VNEIYMPVLVPVLATVVWYLMAAATLTRPLWSRYPAWLESWATCPACAPTWYGAAIAAVFEHFRHWVFFGVAGWASWVLAGLWCTFFCPLLAERLYTTMRAMHPDPEPGSSE